MYFFITSKTFEAALVYMTALSSCINNREHNSTEISNKPLVKGYQSVGSPDLMCIKVVVHL